MPLSDVVVDTDVLMHAENRDSADRDASRALIEKLRTGSTALCFDEGFDPDEALNRSAIASEYFNHLPFGSLALAMVQECALGGRVRVLSTSVPPQVNRAINRLVWDKSDRKFVKVATNSAEKTLVTHNTSDLGPPARELQRICGVEFVDAYGCLPNL